MNRYLFTIILLLGIVSCNTDMVKSQYKATFDGYWSKDNVIEFNFSDLDTIQKHNVFINIRNDETFPFNNLFIIAELDYPDGKSIIDTLEYQMALPDGKWLGKGAGSLKENKLWYKENIVFPTKGVYTLRLSHAMRKNGNVNGILNLEGITDVGFEIVKSK